METATYSMEHDRVVELVSVSYRGAVRAYPSFLQFEQASGLRGFGRNEGRACFVPLQVRALSSRKFAVTHCGVYIASWCIPNASFVGVC